MSLNNFFNFILILKKQEKFRLTIKKQLEYNLVQCSVLAQPFRNLIKLCTLIRKKTIEILYTCKKTPDSFLRFDKKLKHFSRFVEKIEPFFAFKGRK